MKVIHSVSVILFLSLCSCSTVSHEKNIHSKIVIKSGQKLLGQPTWVKGEIWYMTRCALNGESPTNYYFYGHNPDHPEKGFKEIVLMEQPVKGFGQ